MVTPTELEVLKWAASTFGPVGILIVLLVGAVVWTTLGRQKDAKAWLGATEANTEARTKQALTLEAMARAIEENTASNVELTAAYSNLAALVEREGNANRANIEANRAAILSQAELIREKLDAIDRGMDRRVQGSRPRQ